VIAWKIGCRGDPPLFPPAGQAAEFVSPGELQILLHPLPLEMCVRTFREPWEPVPQSEDVPTAALFWEAALEEVGDACAWHSLMPSLPCEADG